MLSGQPIIILKENVERNTGKEAQRSNIMAAKAIAGAVRTTLGPRGMDKMLVGSTGDIVITNDGATIFGEIAGSASRRKDGHRSCKDPGRRGRRRHYHGGYPCRRVNGAGRAPARTGHPPDRDRTGIPLGMEKALEITDSLSLKVDPTDRKILIKIADTAITGKSIEQVKGKLDDIIVDAVMTVAEKVNGKIPR